MASNQHYDYDDDSSQLHHHHRDNSNHNNTGGSSSHFDPCQAYTNNACIEACQVMSSVNDGMCGFHPSNYFNRNHQQDGAHQSSPYLYSPSAPIGPTSCEYCGKRNTDDCTSNLPEEYMLFMGNGGLDRSSRTNNPETGVNSNKINHHKNKDNTAADGAVCPRPKLFFLKKRPPFATPDGWNPSTQYRMNLFEPPSSVEGMGRGWGEVRGQLGNNNAGGGQGSGGVNTSMNNNLNRSYANSGCGSSACGGGGAETEISFSTAGGGGGGDRVTDVSAASGGSLSPVQWVSGLMGALSPS
ncbi:hypothetical protein ACHAXR_012779 [Thalassiosira sp. AJA248-18]